MKRNLISYDNFEQLKDGSFVTVVTELVEAQEHLARTMGVASLTLESFDDSKVIYKKDDGNFLKANYSVEDDALTFDNIEELVLDTTTEDAKRKEYVRGILEAIVKDKEADANILFEKYMQLASQKYQREGTLVDDESIDEATYVRRYGTRKDKSGSAKVFVRKGAKDPRKAAAAKKGHRLHAASYKSGARKRHSQLTKERHRRKLLSHSDARLHALSGGKQYKRRHLDEWFTISNNVLEYVDIVENGYILKESVVRTDEKGEINAVKVPTIKARNEGKIIKQHYDKMIKQDSPKVMREAGLKLAANPRFAAAVTELKRHNNMTDDAALENTLNKIVQVFPSVLYLTKEELAKSIASALESNKVTNFVDATCEFMAEGILRTAFHLHDERVNKMLNMTKTEVKENEDAYEAFVNCTKGLFASIDEAIQTEQKVYEDLYNAVLDVRKIALESRNEEIRNEANDFIGELESILKGDSQGQVEFAEEVAEWLWNIVEVNLPGASDTWSVVKQPHDTVVGDHPQMAKNAKISGTAGEYSGDWGELSPMVGGDSMKKNHGGEGRDHGLGNKGGKDSWPSLDNPNVPASQDWTMKGEKGVDKDNDDLGGWQSSDTFNDGQGLHNPYVPKAMIPKQLVDTSAQGNLD